MSLSIVITTFDEEANISACVQGARLLTDDILVIDSGSRDRTVELAKAAGARVFVRKFDDMASQRNAAIREGDLKGTHALILDADEVVMPPFANALAALLEKRPEIDGVQICRRFHFWGRWVPSASRFPAYIDRVVRIGSVWFKKDGHGEVFDGGTTYVRLDEPLHDEDKKGIGSWLTRHNRYAELEARRDQVLRDGPMQPTNLHWIRAQLRQVPGFPVAMGAYYLVGRGGLLEGSEGRTYCAMKAVYEYFVQLHARDMQRRTKG